MGGLRKLFVVTGSSRGIGFELSKILLEQGHNLLTLSRNPDSIEGLRHPNVMSLKVDLSVNSEIKKVAQYVREKSLKIDALIHNAGLLIRKPFSQTTLDDFEKIYKVNVFAPFELTKVLLPYINRGGHVITISSMAGVQGSSKFSELSAYSSSKGALITLTEVLAEACKDKEVSFNTLALGSTSTEMFNSAFPNMKASCSAKDMASFISDFSHKGHKLFNGKIIHVAKTTP